MHIFFYIIDIFEEKIKIGLHVQVLQASMSTLDRYKLNLFIWKVTGQLIKENMHCLVYNDYT